MNTYPQRECRRCGTSKNAVVIDSNKGLCDECRDSNIRRNWTAEQRNRQNAINAPLTAREQRELDAGVNHMFRRGISGALD